MDTKQCNVCRVSKPSDCFTFAEPKRDGTRSRKATCKECSARISRERRAAEKAGTAPPPTNRPGRLDMNKERLVIKQATLPQYKVCSGCGQRLHQSLFGTAINHGKLVLECYCRKCKSARHLQYKRLHKEKAGTLFAVERKRDKIHADCLERFRDCAKLGLPM